MTPTPYLEQIQDGAVDRPWYGYSIYNAGILADRLEYPKISILELGVAGGEGLLNVEKHVRNIEKELSVEFEVYGFDTGTGLPEPQDYRDMPYLWEEGDYQMDHEELKSELERAQLVLGDINETSSHFYEDQEPAPVGCALFDLDFYSSTRAALSLFEASESRTLPRVISFFHDVAADPIHAYSEYTGALRAIKEFNNDHQKQKIAKIRFSDPVHRNLPFNPQRIYMYHDFEHGDYDTTVRERTSLSI